MKTIKLTSKRQATFPKELCEEMKLRPGDSVIVDPKIVDGERVWVVRPVRPVRVVETSWFGSLRRYAKGKPHDMESIRAGIAKARKRGRT